MYEIHIVNSRAILSLWRSPSFDLRPPKCQHRLNNQLTSNSDWFAALRQYRFDRSPLWRMADGKVYVKSEVTFRKSTNQHFDKKGAESRRRPTPPAGDRPRQLALARRPTTTTRSTPARLPPTPCQEKEATPPPTQTIPATTRPHIKHDRTQKTATIQPSPVTRRPPTPPSSPDSLPPKKSRFQSPPLPPADNEPPTKFFYDHYKEPRPIQEKFDLQEALCVQTRKKNAVVVKTQRLQKEDE